jgi:hypothetical protein
MHVRDDALHDTLATQPVHNIDAVQPRPPACPVCHSSRIIRQVAIMHGSKESGWKRPSNDPDDECCGVVKSAAAFTLKFVGNVAMLCGTLTIRNACGKH